MRPLILTLLLAAPAMADKPKTIKLEAPGDEIKVSREGAFVRLIVREPGSEDTEKNLTRRQAIELTNAIDDVVKKLAKPSDSAAKASWLHLVSRPVRVCDGNSCRVVEVPDAPSAPTPYVNQRNTPYVNQRYGGGQVRRAFRPLGRVVNRCRGCRR